MSDDSFTSLEGQIRECFGRVVYTHKTHEKMADGCSATLRRIKIGQIIVAAVTSTSALSLVFSNSSALKIVTACLSILNLLITGYMKGFDPGGTAQKHRDAAASLWPIRESYLSLLTDLRMRCITDEKAKIVREDLQSKLTVIYKGAPQTDGKAYAAAQAALKDNEELTFSDAEIDHFLPSSLRKAGGDG